MTWFFAILIVLALGGIAVVAAGWGTPMAEVYDDRPDVDVPADRPLTGADLRKVRFSLALRGYRMSEVDALLDRVAAQLELREADEAAAEDERRATGEGRGGEPTD
jgi:DivIVA domain-containing protein